MKILLTLANRKRRHTMSLITEASLREHFKNNTDVTIEISDKDIITPSAKQFLKDRGIELTKLSKDNVKETTVENVENRKNHKFVENRYKLFETVEESFKPKFISNYDGGYYEVKPEYMTHLNNNILVFKDDKRIIFRGRLDSLQSLILEIQWQLKKENSSKGLLDDLSSILEVSRNLLRAEVLEEPYKMDEILGLDEQTLRAHSHNPKKYYGVQHFLPNMEMGIEVVLLNRLRTEVREVELAAMRAFRQGTLISREDIILVLNRLSSAVYILMCRVRGMYYR